MESSENGRLLSGKKKALGLVVTVWRGRERQFRAAATGRAFRQNITNWRSSYRDSEYLMAAFTGKGRGQALHPRYGAWRGWPGADDGTQLMKEIEIPAALD